MPRAVIGLAGALSDSFYQRDDVFYRDDYKITSADGSIAGDITINTPDLHILDLDGCVQPNWTQTFYNNIYLIPVTIDFGPVVATVQQTFLIWNAFLHEVTLESIEAESDGGLNLSNPTPPPSIYAPTQLTQFIIEATTQGPVQIDATYVFTFDVQVKTLSVSGIRAELLDILPNWAQPYNVSYEYRTEILPTRSGKEQRRSLRPYPRRSFAYQADVFSDDKLRLDAILDTWQDKTLIMPVMTRSLVSPYGMGAYSETMGFTLPDDGPPSWVEPGATVALRYGKRVDLRVIDSIELNQVRFTAAGPEPWPEDTIMHPALPGRISPTQPTSHPTNRALLTNLTFNVDPSNDSLIDQGTPGETYNFYELFLQKPNWRRPVDRTYAHEVDMIDFGRNTWQPFIVNNFGERISEATFLSRTRTEAYEMESFFIRHYGRQVSFYVPSWEPDIIPSQPLSSASRFMRSAGLRLYNSYNSSPVFKHIFLRFNDGTYLIRPVASISQSGEDSIIDATTNWPANIALDEIVMVSWLTRVRFASDLFTMSWRTTEVAEFNLSLKTLLEEQ